MASLRDLKRQIDSIKNISKVTEALQTVSAVKFRKAESRVKKARPYAENVEQMMRDVAKSATGSSPLLAGRDEVRRVAVATITADRGLAGGFNAQVLRRTVRLREELDGEKVQVASGRKSVSFFRFRGIELAETYTGFSDSPTYEQAREIGQALVGLFDDEEADEVHLVYNRFETALTQRPVVTRLLPVAQEDEEDEDEGENGSDASYFEYIPDAETVLKKLVPRYVETMIWQALLESAAGEHGARMTAMKNATDNANELSDNLTLQMNKARQAQITQEILEIVSGAEALSAG
ncbi:F0F1 ATP synthase subunit gamma [Rubrobacter marinus]|uniref:ATP synthase gamma chain n=1 Tax=Rubrobacter marinus TaxID=2653852 RepID=A0A6G8PWW9_9ACTN|nr:F0F1 ATP synthase subunit gamma [Rubrobacter marinus]QIN78719.1 F0F1 ATP synthase subunit gamma [Rubrobacter marinus]